VTSEVDTSASIAATTARTAAPTSALRPAPSVSARLKRLRNTAATPTLSPRAAPLNVMSENGTANTTDSNRAVPGHRKALHLLWAIPVVIVGSYLPYVSAAITKCGVFGQDCYPGGPGFSAERAAEVLAQFAPAGLLMFLAVMLVPWMRRALVRLPFAIAAGVGWTAALWFYLAS